MSLKGRVGVFGGTFNPLHNAHIHVALAAMSQCELSEILFVPNGIPPHKQELDGASKEDRFRMVELAIASHANVRASRIEIDREGPSYTIDTLQALKDDYAQGICFIVGADRLLELDTWKEPDALLESVPFVIAPRSGVSLESFDTPPFDIATIYPLDMKEVDLSSSWLREKIHRGEAIDEWVPSAVAAYVEERGLYRDKQLAQASGI
ncbi:nicotinate-nucleotide adenylyltransferase [Candidatus Bipolaricaulota bacterium]